MKFSTVTSTIFGAALLFASKAVAEVDFFDYPAPNTVFQVGKSIQFVVDDAPDGDDGDDRVYADLYTANGRFVKTIRSWWGDDLDNDDFVFSWKIDSSIKSGRYFIELYSEDDDDDDDVARSFMFEVATPVRKASTTARRTRVQQPARGTVARKVKGRYTK
ncbi:unnamed protein product [Mucor hiemalis]